eukprot:UN02738
MDLSWLTLIIPVVIIVILFAIWFVSEKVPKFDINGKNVIITGGSSGIGLATAELLVKNGAKNIALIARKATLLEDAKKQLEVLAKAGKHDVTIHIYSVDVSKYNAMCDAVNDFVAKVGKLDLVVASAGVSRPALIDDIPFDEFEWMSNINYLGVVSTCKACIPTLKQQKSGRIVLISSMAGLFAITGYTSYAPTKYAVRGFAEALFMELKPFNVYVSVCNPPDVDTPMYKEEMKSKPKECVLMSEGTGVFSAERLATDIVNGIKDYKFFIQTGFDGFLVGHLTAGTMPGANFVESLISIMMASIARLIVLFVRYDFDNIAKKCHAEREAEQKKA